MSFPALARGFVLALLCAGCGDTPVEDCGPNTGIECPSSDEVIAGVNLSDLFAAPSPAEIEAAQARLASGEGDRSVAVETEIDRGGRETLTILRGRAGGTDGAFYAAVRQPPRAPGDQRQRPVVMFLGNSPDLDVTTALADFPIRESLRDDVVIVFATLRGGTLRADGQAFQSEASGVGAFDPALSADVLALLAYVRSQAGTFNANPERIAFVGHGAGGTAALLAGARTDADDYILSLAAPSTFFAGSVREATREYLRGGVSNPFPGLTSVLDSTVGRVRDGELSIVDARALLLDRSPASLVPSAQRSRPLAYLFGVHGERDTVVPVDQTRALTPLTQDGEGVVLIVPEATHQTILQDGQVLSTGGVFLCQTLFPDDPNCS